MNISTSLKYALGTTAGLIAYFIIMKIFGLEAQHELRIFNFVIVLAGVVLLHRSMYNAQPPHSYLNGLFSGFKMGAMATLFFIVFMGIYSTLIDPNFVEVLQSGSIWGGQLSIPQIVIATLFEGLGSCAIISFISMQYFKDLSSDFASDH